MKEKQKSLSEVWLARIGLGLLMLFFVMYAVSSQNANRSPKLEWPHGGLATLIPEPYKPHGEILEDTRYRFNACLTGVSDEEYLDYLRRSKETFGNAFPMALYAETLPELSAWSTVDEMIDYAYLVATQDTNTALPDFSDWVSLRVYKESFDDVSYFSGYDLSGNCLTLSQGEGEIHITVETAEYVMDGIKEHIPAAPNDKTEGKDSANPLPPPME